MRDGWVCCPDCGKRLFRIEGGKMFVWCKGEKKEVVIDIYGEEGKEHTAR